MQGIPRGWHGKIAVGLRMLQQACSNGEGKDQRGGPRVSTHREVKGSGECAGSWCAGECCGNKMEVVCL